MIASRPPQPTLTSVTNADGVAEGRPGELIVVTGSGFSATTRVYFAVSRTRLVEGPIESRQSQLIICQVPDVTGVGPFDGHVFVASGSGGMLQSGTVPFRFNPLEEIKLFDGWDPMQINNKMTVGGWALYSEWKTPSLGQPFYTVKHYPSGSALRYEADDFHFGGIVLENGFVVDSWELSYEPLRVPGDHRLTITMDPTRRPGRERPAIAVNWTFHRGLWTDQYWIIYKLAVFVRGPRGLSFGPSAPGLTGVIDNFPSL